MTLHLYNTLSRQKERFAPLNPPHVLMYNCGPTVYSEAHIGNFRAFLFADLLRRWIEDSGHTVTQVMNITDVGHMREEDEEDAGEDRMEIAARRENLDPWKIAEKYTDLFFRDLDALGIRRAHHYPRATEHIAQMIAMIEKLLQEGHAYEVGGQVYFSVESFPDYGRLSGNTPEDLLAGARVEVGEDKADPRDFFLWKKDPAHVMQWDSPWGRGFPGWHIECSAMSAEHLDKSIDIHTGGEDNIFPHHECEIAQSESSNDGTPFVKYWLHTRFLQVEGGKMSKTLGNLYTVNELEQKGYSPLAVRLLLLRGHYRQLLNFTFDGLDEAAATVDRLQHFAADVSEIAGDTPSPEQGPDWAEAAWNKFVEGMDDDLNVSVALDGLFTLVRESNRHDLSSEEAARVTAILRHMDRILGILQETPDVQLEEDIQALLDEREAARGAQNWERADAIREELASKGIEVLDGKGGGRWRRMRPSL